MLNPIAKIRQKRAMKFAFGIVNSMPNSGLTEQMEFQIHYSNLRDMKLKDQISYAGNAYMINEKSHKI